MNFPADMDSQRNRNRAPERGEGEGAAPKGGGFADGRFAIGGRNGGADLNYTDDKLDSYSSIWEGGVTDTGTQDHRRVITALKNISKGTDLEDYLDVDNVLKYMAVHTFSVNMDSLSGDMAHNYYLYEHNGKLNILPWDYNMAFGGMGMYSASEVVNDAIDTPFQGTEFFDALLEKEEYLSVYHEYLRQLTEEYVSGGKFEETYRRIRNQIDVLVQTDPTAFYSYEEYETAADMLYLTVLLRAESIQGQLDGTIPSTDEGQRAASSGFAEASAMTDVSAMVDDSVMADASVMVDASAMVETSTIDIDAMGGFHMGRPQSGFKDMPEGFGDRDGETSAANRIVCAVCLAGAILALVMVKRYQRIPKKKIFLTFNGSQPGSKESACYRTRSEQ